MEKKMPQVIETAELMHIDYDQILKDLQAHGELDIDEFIQSATQPGRLKDQPPESLRQYLEGYEDLETLIDLLSHGQQSFMKQNFEANGGRRIGHSASYVRAKQLCHHAIAKLYKKGRAPLIPWDF